jgi:xanthine dehydrogenase accessory factor
MGVTEVLERTRDLTARAMPHAVVTVVRAIAPTSAYVGAQAIVLADGTIQGWIGGGCTQGVVVDVAKAAINTGEPKLIRITNDRLQDADEVEQHVMSCASNGTIELFIQPYSAGHALYVAGRTPAAEEARFLAERLRIRLVSSVADARVVLIATQGEGDEAALESALRSPASHILMIASHRKAEKLRDLMRIRGIDAAQLARLEAPAGPDAGAKTPSEIALVALTAVLARLRGRILTSVERGPQRVEAPDSGRAATARADGFVNPVCGRTIDTANPKHVEQYDGTSFYFCCDGCWNTFRGNPAKYASIHHEHRRHP